jgi:anti-anti-sigma factor
VELGVVVDGQCVSNFAVAVSHHRDHEWFVRLVGDLDVASAPYLQHVLEDVDGDVTVDCAALDFIDARGLGTFVELSNHVHRVTLVNINPLMRRVLNITGLSTTFLV